MDPLQIVLIAAVLLVLGAITLWADERATPDCRHTAKQRSRWELA